MINQICTLVVFSAYAAISAILMVYVRIRTGTSKLASTALATLIFVSGAAHLIEALTSLHWLYVLCEVLEAVLAVVVSIILFILLPRMLRTDTSAGRVSMHDRILELQGELAHLKDTKVELEKLIGQEPKNG